jgi:hypothetical protein
MIRIDPNGFEGFARMSLEIALDLAENCAAVFEPRPAGHAAAAAAM